MRFVRHLAGETRGAVVIETAFAVPILAILMLGAFDVSKMVARQMELQEVAAEISAGSMAKVPDDAQLLLLKQMAQTSGRLQAGQVTLVRKIKCGIDTTQYADGYTCPVGAEKSTLIAITLTTNYTPVWTSFGVGRPATLTVKRSVQVL